MTVLTAGQCFDEYIRLLYHWNRRIRLVGESDPVRFRRTLLAEVRETLAKMDDRDWDVAIDIGSGNGLVAVPLAVVHRDRRVVALEPQGKKATFLRQVRHRLGLTNLEIRQERLETYQPDTTQGERVLWTARAIEIPPEMVLDCLRRFPQSQLLLFTAPDTPSWTIVARAGTEWRVEDILQANNDRGRRVVLITSRPTGTGAESIPG